MDVNSFIVPKIPTIYVPQSQPNKSEPPKVSKISKSPSTQSKSENEIPNKESNTATLPPPPQLCASCSQILLSYFVPLQQYVNEVVELARSQQATVPTAPKLPNTDILSHVPYAQTQDQTNNVNQVSTNVNIESRGLQQNAPESSYNQMGQSTTISDDNNNRIFNYETGIQYESNQIQNNQNQNLNQTETHDNRNQRYSNQNQGYDNQNQRYDNQTPDYENRSEENIDNNLSEDQKQSHSSQIESNAIQSKKTNGDNRLDSTEEHSNIQMESSADNNYDNSKDSSLKTADNVVKKSRKSSVSNRVEDHSEQVSLSSPFAFVTIAYNNLSAANAIILANSLLLTNNKSMNYTDEFGNRNIIQVPFVILLGGNIDPSLKDAIFMVFDEVISQPMDVRVALLSDESFGIQQYKLQLWKELLSYKKCLYLESSTMAVGRVTNLFEECQELSASVDWLFTDNFNCSVFVFEPNMTTYEQIISFALFHQRCSAQKDDSFAETLDEMTLLNQFFASKWKRISFIYNFVRNDAVYTQIPAFMKYGDSIRIVNFGHMMSQSPSLGNQSGLTSTQPWHIMFDLLASSQKDVINGLSIDNFSKFYLNCFIKRLWPVLQSHLTPLLITKYGVGRREWSIFELIRLLSSESGIETDDHMFTQNPINLRRIKSPAEKITQFDSLSIEDEEILTENISSDNLSDGDSESRETGFDEQMSPMKEQIEEKPVEGETIEEPLSPQQLDERSKREFEAGRIDWMGAHQSDKIINRLKKMIRND